MLSAWWLVPAVLGGVAIGLAVAWVMMLKGGIGR